MFYVGNKARGFVPPKKTRTSGLVSIVLLLCVFFPLETSFFWRSNTAKCFTIHDNVLQSYSLQELDATIHD